MKIELLEIRKKKCPCNLIGCNLMYDEQVFSGYHNGKYAIGHSMSDVIRKLLEIPERKSRWTSNFWSYM